MHHLYQNVRCGACASVCLRLPRWFSVWSGLWITELDYLTHLVRLTWAFLRRALEWHAICVIHRPVCARLSCRRESPSLSLSLPYCLLIWSSSSWRWLINPPGIIKEDLIVGEPSGDPFGLTWTLGRQRERKWEMTHTPNDSYTKVALIQGGLWYLGL